MSHRAALRARVTSPEAQVRFKRWFDAAPIYSGTITANRWGWQVARSRTKNAAIAVRRSLRTSAADPGWAATLDRDGIVVISDFLPADDFQWVAAAYEEYSRSPRVRDIGPENDSGIRYLSGPVISDAAGDPAATINAALASDGRMISLAEHVIGRRIRPPVRVVLQLLEAGNADDDHDREQILHADRAFSCVKAIFAVDEITAETSPFVYAKGTQRITAERLQYEAAMGVREAYLRRARGEELRAADDGLEVVRGRHVMTEATRRRLGVEETPMVCAANSLIVTNNAGFHRRGHLAGGTARRTLWVNFYRYQRPWYGRLAHRLAKSVIDTDNVSRAPASFNRLMS